MKLYQFWMGIILVMIMLLLVFFYCEHTKYMKSIDETLKKMYTLSQKPL